MYNWESYSFQVYEHLTDESTYQEQIIALEKNRETAHAKGQALPPGFHAHLGMLYLKDSQSDKAASEFTEEKTVFPESATFIDFLFAMLRGEPHASAANNADTKDTAEQNTAEDGKP